MNNSISPSLPLSKSQFQIHTVLEKEKEKRKRKGEGKGAEPIHPICRDKIEITWKTRSKADRASEEEKAKEENIHLVDLLDKKDVLQRIPCSLRHSNLPVNSFSPARTIPNTKGKKMDNHVYEKEKAALPWFQRMNLDMNIRIHLYAYETPPFVFCHSCTYMKRN